MSEPRRWAPRAQVDNITVTTDRVWVSWKTLFTAAAKQSAAASYVITAQSCSLQINLWKLFGLAQKHTCSSFFFFFLVLHRFPLDACKRLFAHLDFKNVSQKGECNPEQLFFFFFYKSALVYIQTVQPLVKVLIFWKKAFFKQKKREENLRSAEGKKGRMASIKRSPWWSICDLWPIRAGSSHLKAFPCFTASI